MARYGYTTKLVLLLILSFILSSCASHRTARHKDGPPSFPVNEKAIPNATPKAEPLAKYGNMSSYRVRGRRYYVLPSSKNYVAVGTASWYGTQFHAHRTSSGERYNMLGMTAAHTTLPLPTYVEVTNLRNHKKVIVKVNDRGPFEGNRLIDLSYVAAKKLGMIGHGTSLVRVKAIDPYAYYHQPNIITASHAIRPSRLAESNNQFPPYYLQVGAFKNKDRAERLRRRLTPLFATRVSIRANQRSHLYKVQIGPLRDATAMRKTQQRLRKLGLPTNKINGIS